MYTATSMLSKARSNPIYGQITDNRKLYYRNIYLKSEHWRNLRKEKLEKSPSCEKCGTCFSLDVHHKKYRSLYDVSIKDLKTLCRVCHNKEHLTLLKKKRKSEKKKLKYGVPKTINFHLLKWLLKSLIILLKSNLSKRNYLKKKKVINTTEFKEMTNYVSIHY